jgi:hypothetical protein
LNRLPTTLVALVLATLASGCEPEVGSEKWCEKMMDTPKSDWLANDVKTFAQHCIFKEYEDDEEQEER